MARKNMHENFKKYTEKICRHPNYSGLPIERKNDGELSWVSTKKSEIGKERIEWVKCKALDLGVDISKPYYSKVMFEIHPDKMKVCQICGEEMSIKYIYPNRHFINYLTNTFDYVPSVFDTIDDINEHLANIGLSEDEIKKVYIKRMKLNKKLASVSLNELVNRIEELCRTGHKNTFGPGSMSNFPDRFDGFHSYNRCCREREDKGRSKDNLRSYVKDRRAYEYWSDGNIHAANKYMKSKRFKDVSADHIGPISLGFVHDPRFLQPMVSGDNSSKNNRLENEDLEKLIQLESELGICPVSWFAAIIWDKIKELFQSDQLDVEVARKCLITNITYFFEVLWNILEYTGENGELFLEEHLLKPKKRFFEYEYIFDENGRIVEDKPRHVTDSTKKEYGRFVRISFNSVFDFHEKENRNIKVKLNNRNQRLLEKTLESIKLGSGYYEASKELFIELVSNIQIYLIQEFF